MSRRPWNEIVKSLPDKFKQRLLYIRQERDATGGWLHCGKEIASIMRKEFPTSQYTSEQDLSEIAIAIGAVRRGSGNNGSRRRTRRLAKKRIVDYRPNAIRVVEAKLVTAIALRISAQNDVDALQRTLNMLREEFA